MSASKVCEESDVNGATINVSEHLQKVEGMYTDLTKNKAFSVNTR